MRQLRIDPIILISRLVQGRRNGAAYPVPSQAVLVSHHRYCIVDSVFAHWRIRVVSARNSSLVRPPVIDAISCTTATACRDNGTRYGGISSPSVLTPALNCFTRSAGIVHNAASRSNWSGVAIRSSLGRTPVSSNKRIASFVNCKVLVPPQQQVTPRSHRSVCEGCAEPVAVSPRRYQYLLPGSGQSGPQQWNSEKSGSARCGIFSHVQCAAFLYPANRRQYISRGDFDYRDATKDRYQVFVQVQA